MVTIRNLTEDDIDGICGLWQQFASMREEMSETRVLNDDASDYFFGYATGLLQRKDALTLVAEADDGTLLGYLVAQKQRRPPIYHHTRVAYLSDAFVVESARGQGILKRFIDDLKSWCKREGITAIDVQIFEANKHAQEVYRHLGFSDYRTVFRAEI
ncbi:MAG: GNAT family N-acetyltransferase [Thermoplasmatota archaeon]